MQQVRITADSKYVQGLCVVDGVVGCLSMFASQQTGRCSRGGPGAACKWQLKDDAERERQATQQVRYCASMLMLAVRWVLMPVRQLCMLEGERERQAMPQVRCCAGLLSMCCGVGVVVLVLWCWCWLSDRL
jgi:hypothetical protein